MKPIEIGLTFNNELIGVGKMIDIIRKKTYRTVLISDVKIDKQLKIPKDEIITIDISIGDKYYTFLELAPVDDLLINPTDSSLKFRFKGKVFRNFKLGMGLFNAWNKNKGLHDWRKLTEKQKYFWISAALNYGCWGDERAKKELRKKVVINGKKVKSEVEFYCHLGEAFYKKAGYMGTNLNAFEDCLRMFRFTVEDRPTIIIKNFRKLEDTLDKISQGYARSMLDIFDDNKLPYTIELP